MKHRTLRLIAWRLLMALPILFGVVVVTFVLIRALPGDPAIAYASGPNMSQEDIDAIRRAMGLDKSLAQQFLIYLRNIAHLDFGNSMITGQPVLEDFKERLPATLELAIFAFALSLIVALPIGVLSALYRDSWIDQLARVVTSVSAAMPGFFFGLILIFVFYFLLGIGPEPIGRLSGWSIAPPTVTGLMTVDTALIGDWPLFREAVAKMIMPAASMAIFAVAPLMRMMRGGMIDALDSDYIKSAQAYGLSRRRILLQHALPNAMLPVLATMGMVLSTMLGANIMIEKLFSWPGIGSYSVNALTGVDYAPVQAFVLIVAVLFVLMTLAIDLLSAAIDPRYKVKG
ncbi:ABC transporter permease [Pseudooceanicola aestuarii]|uniref:ABC transporter permease n=1 Tax=Pseudooceanicola aestuarii TaxID=2697319 RepID=UPI0013D03BB8|nr:ABC transporter permease [Pseudooceanicola aestuarii]